MFDLQIEFVSSLEIIFSKLTLFILEIHAKFANSIIMEDLNDDALTELRRDKIIAPS